MSETTIDNHPNYDEPVTEEELLREAYEMGYTRALDVSAELPDDHDRAIEEVSRGFEGYTGGASYANNVLPTLRAMAGYEDDGHGTYTRCNTKNVPYDRLARLVDAFRLGYEEKCLGNEKNPGEVLW